MSDDLVHALASGDLTGVIDIYLAAADSREDEGDVDAACFLLTHAWVHALEAGDSRARDIRARLIARGRENET